MGLGTESSVENKGLESSGETDCGKKANWGRVWESGLEEFREKNNYMCV